jgi:hypothetical protein
MVEMRWRSRARNERLSPEIVDGWRAWSVVEHDGRLRLSSLTRAEDWEPLVPFVAECGRRAHDVPDPACVCGVYAADTPEGLGGLGRIAGGAIGQVSLWGRIARHRKGFRAATAYPARLRMVCVVCLGAGVGRPAELVDRDRTSARDRLVPLCEAHAAGRSLPPSRPIEQRLLSTYGVEMVPDEPIERIRRSRHGRPEIRLAAAVVAVVVIAVAAALTLGRHPALTAPPAAPAPAGSQRTSDVQLPLNRSSEGLISTPRIRVLLLTPSRFAQPRCGKLIASGVRRVECADSRADIFVEDVGPAGADRVGTCSPETVEVTLSHDRLVCWRRLP